MGNPSGLLNHHVEIMHERVVPLQKVRATYNIESLG